MGITSFLFKSTHKYILKAFLLSVMISSGVQAAGKEFDSPDATSAALQKYHAQFLNKTTTEKRLELFEALISWPVFIQNFIHEMGHAVTARLLLDSPISVHLGAMPSEVPMKLKEKPGITVHSFKSDAFASTKSVASAPRMGSMLAAGPIAGYTSLRLMNKALDRLAEKYPDSRSINCVVFSYKIIITFLMAQQVVYGLTPISSVNGDGSQLWRILIPQKIMASLPQKLLDVCSNEKTEAVVTLMLAATLMKRNSAAFSTLHGRIFSKE